MRSPVYDCIELAFITMQLPEETTWSRLKAAVFSSIFQNLGHALGAPVEKSQPEY